MGVVYTICIRLSRSICGQSFAAQPQAHPLVPHYDILNANPIPRYRRLAAAGFGALT